MPSLATLCECDPAHFVLFEYNFSLSTLVEIITPPLAKYCECDAVLYIFILHSKL